MSNDKRRELVAELRRELQTAGELDPDTRSLLERINEDIDNEDHTSMLDKAKQLEAQFAARYPTAERVARAVMDSLGKMGI